MPGADPWLTARMRDYTLLRRGETDLFPAVEAAVRAYLGAVGGAVLGTAQFTAAADDRDDTPPDLDRFPPDSVWTRLVERYITPVARRIFRSSYETLASADTEAFSSQAARYSGGLGQRLLGFPRRVWERVRAAVSEGLARRQPPSALRERVGEVLALRNFSGQADTLTRTEVHTAVCAGAMAAALDEQARTSQRWTKTWLRTRDDRVRDTHRAADGQVRPLEQPFTVGGFPLQFPGDPLGPPQEVINCRCSARYQPVDEASSITASLEET